MTKAQPTIHVGIDVSKDKLAVAIAGGEVRDEVLSLGTFENAPASVDRLLKKLSERGSPVSVCCEAGPRLSWPLRKSMGLPRTPLTVSSGYQEPEGSTRVIACMRDEATANRQLRLTRHLHRNASGIYLMGRQ